MKLKTLAIGTALVGSLVTAGFAVPALAQRPGWRTDTSTTSADQGKIDAIQKKYDADLTRMEAQIRTTGRDLDQALAAQDTAKAEELRQKLSEQQKSYFDLRNKAWSELRDAGYPGAWASGGWTCPWHDEMMNGYGPNGMMGGYGRYGMMNGRGGSYGGCGW